MQTTPNAINTLLSSPFLQSVHLTLLATNVKFKQENTVMCFDLSDGTQNCKAFVDLSEHPNLNFTTTIRPLILQTNTYMITITRHTYLEYNGKKMVQVLNINRQQPTPQRQKAQTTKVQADTFEEVKTVQKIQPSKKVEVGNATINRVTQPNQTSQEMIELQISDEEQLQTITEQKMRQFQKISDLYVDFLNWQILVRIFDSSYKEFQSKMGKMTKLLNLMLIDKTGLKIETSYFGQNALTMYQKVKKGCVYRISNGQIKEHAYNTNLPEDQSKLTILFNKDTQVIEVKDVPAIPKNNEQVSSIEQVIGEINFQKTYNVVAVLLQIGDDMQTEKENGKKIFRKTILVGDPQTTQSIEVLIWNRNIFVDEAHLFKVVCLKNFKLNSYRDKMSLTSTFKSEIQAKNYPKWVNSIKRVRDIHFVSVNSQEQMVRQSSNELKVSEERTIGDLENQIRYLENNETIVSELQVWITYIKFQGKWCYGACNNPKCKKAAQSFARCQVCGFFNEQVNKKYMLPVELTDYTGSLWLTAFDDFGNEIMKGFRLDELDKMPDTKLKEVAEKQFYQQFRVKVLTKKEGEGNIKHTICGKPILVTIQKTLQSNLAKIKKAVYE